MKRHTAFAFAVFSLLLACAGCQKKTESSSHGAAELRGAPSSSTAKPPEKVLQLYTWSNYISPEIIKLFEGKSGVKVVMNFFSSNEELLAKLQAGARGYDIIMPSSYMIRALKELKLIQPLGPLDWPELSKISKRFRSPTYDPAHEYAIPYQWGTTGIAVNRARIKSKVDGWEWIFNHPELKGQISMLDDAPAVIGSALKYLGYSYNDSSPGALAKAKALLLKQKKWLKSYSAEIIPALENGEIAVTQAYSGDALQAARKNPNIEYVFPKEGAELFVDNLVIPVGAPSPDLAKDFMRFSLQIQVAELQVKHLFYSPVLDLSDAPGMKELLKNPAINPTDEQAAKLEIMMDNPDRLETIQKIWTELKSS